MLYSILDTRLYTRLFTIHYTQVYSKLYNILLYYTRLYYTKKGARSAKDSFFRLPPRTSWLSQHILYYLREPLGAKVRILSHTTSAGLPQTLSILLLTRPSQKHCKNHRHTGKQSQNKLGPRDHGTTSSQKVDTSRAVWAKKKNLQRNHHF